MRKIVPKNVRPQMVTSPNGNNPIRYIDPWGLAIILSGTGVEKQTIYDNLRLLTRDTVSYTVAENGDWLLDYKSVNGEKFNVGTNLIRKIIDNTYTCLIMVDNSDDSGSKPIIREHASRPEMGTGGIIWLNTKQDTLVLTEYIGDNGQIGVQAESLPTEIALGHELIHVSRYMQGKLIPSNSLTYEGYANHMHRDKNISSEILGEISTEKGRMEELETTGISYYRPDGTFVGAANWVTTENALRKEHGYGRRVKYGIDNN